MFTRHAENVRFPIPEEANEQILLARSYLMWLKDSKKSQMQTQWVEQSVEQIFKRLKVRADKFGPMRQTISDCASIVTLLERIKIKSKNFFS